MRVLLAFGLMGLAQLSVLASASAAPSCAREDFAQAVDRAGAALRQLNTDNAPRLRAKLRELKELRGWPDAGFEEKAYEILQDERMANVDRQANDLLAKLDTLGTVDPGAEPDCARLEELRAVGIELQATVKAKAAYTLAKLDQMLGGPAVATEPKPRGAEVRPPAPAPVQPAPKATARAPDAGWAPRPAPPAQVAIAPPPPPPASNSTPTPPPPPTPQSARAARAARAPHIIRGRGLHHRRDHGGQRRFLRQGIGQPRRRYRIPLQEERPPRRVHSRHRGRRRVPRRPALRQWHTLCARRHHAQDLLAWAVARHPRGCRRLKDAVPDLSSETAR